MLNRLLMEWSVIHTVGYVSVLAGRELLVYSIRDIRSILVSDELLCSSIPYDMEHVLVQSVG